jgi:hypothetical protein
MKKSMNLAFNEKEKVINTLEDELKKERLRRKELSTNFKDEIKEF